MQFHFTPTSASWLNLVEVWFSILQGQSLSGTSFTSLKQLQEHIDAYVNAYNDKAKPFVWTKKKVRQRRFKGRRSSTLIPIAGRQCQNRAWNKLCLIRDNFSPVGRSAPEMEEGRVMLTVPSYKTNERT